ncbi:MAG: glycosyltransferase family 10 [Syntrophomonadaceae bacterium]|nr:glycosyltransferase family 10 [Syntrophomonadaceae bacterium]
MRSVLLKVDDAVMNNRIFNLHKPLYCLRERLNDYDISFHTADLGSQEACDKIIIFDLNNYNLEYVKECIARGWQEKLILMLWEGPVVIPQNWEFENLKHFSKLLTWNDELVDNRQYFKFYYPQTELPYYGIELPYAEKKLCTMIVSNKMYPQPQELYSERIKAIRYFGEMIPEQFDLYGYGWDYSVNCYRGTVKSKEHAYARYKYAVCYENTTGLKGYITEKIFDCFRGGCVPIYLGADNVSNYIPPETFIDRRDFGSYDDLLQYLITMDEQRYQRYITNIAAYAHSEKFELFGIDNFVNIMLSHLI